MRDTELDFRKLKHWLIGAVLAVCLVLLALATAFIWSDHQRSSREISNTLQSEALAFSEYVTATLRAANVVLEASQADIQKRGGYAAMSEDALHALFQQHLRLIADDGKKIAAHSLLIVDANGLLHANSLSKQVVHRDLSDQEYYRHHRADPSAAVWLSPLYLSHSSGLKVFMLSLRLSDSTGQFQGVLAVSVRISHFEAYFDQISLSADQTISLFRQDGKPLFRYPMVEGFERSDFGGAPEFQAMRMQQRGSMVLRSPFDHTLRLAGYENGRQYPTVAIVTHLEESALREWQQHTLATLCLVAAALAALGLLLAFSLRQIGIAEAAIRERGQVVASLAEVEAQLVQSEKLAQLGRAVAVFSHDIGTPIGNGKVAITSLLERGAELRSALADGSLRRSALNEHLEIVDEAASLVHGNLERAANLLNDFKLSAMDQATSHRRSVDLQDWLQGLAHSLSPQFRGGPLRLEVEVEPGLQLDTLPGPLSQVISNLVSNARIHAFDPDEEGCVKIIACRSGERISLRVEDNGKGMAAEIQQHVFEPFFTTRADAGGTGLGLHIVQSLVEEALGGTLSVDSTPGKGTRFVIDLPDRTPDESAPLAGAPKHLT